MSEVLDANMSEKPQFLTDIYNDIEQIGEYLASGDYEPKDAIKEMFDLYWSAKTYDLTDEQSQELQEHIFNRAKDTEVDFDEVLALWQEISEAENQI